MAANSSPSIPYTRRRVYPTFFYPLLGPKFDVQPAQLQPALEAIAQHTNRPETLVYVHIPFCESICGFCGFYRLRKPDSKDGLAKYVERVVAEAAAWGKLSSVQESRITSVYIGGGTPAVLPSDLIKQLIEGLFEHLPIPHGVELSFEGEVRSITDELLRTLKRLGVSRVSFGVQSFDEDVRRYSALVPTVKDISNCAKRVRDHGFGVTIDLMYGLPGQTPDVFKQDLHTAIETIKADHVDLYDMICYPNTELFQKRERYKEVLPSDIDRETMLLNALNTFKYAGYNQMTSEDFVRPGFEYRMKPLVYGGVGGQAQILGLGACATGYFAEAGYRNKPIEGYMESPADSFPIERLRNASRDEIQKRAMVFFPRILNLNVDSIPFGVATAHKSKLDNLVSYGLIEESVQGKFSMTDAGLIWLDNVILEFLSPDEKRMIFQVVQ